MSIPFPSIPEHIRAAIIAKQDIRDFPKFFECSRDSYSDSNKVRSRFVVSPSKLFVNNINQDSEVTLEFSKEEKLRVSWKLLTTIPVKIEANKLIHNKVTNSVCDWTIDFLMNTHSSFDALSIRSISCSPIKFNELCCALRTKRFFCFDQLSTEYLRSLNMENIDYIEVDSIQSDADLLLLKIPKMDLLLTNVTNSGINALIKEWIADVRDIKDITISTVNTVEHRLIFEGIDYNVEDDRDYRYSKAYSIKIDDSKRLTVRIRNDFVQIYNAPLK